MVNTKKLPTKADKCTSGWSCGKACISRKKECRKNMLNRDALSVAKGFWQLMNTDVKEFLPKRQEKYNPMVDEAGETIRAKGTANMSEAQMASLRSWERDHASKEYESASFINSAGEVLWQTEGKKGKNADSVTVNGAINLPPEQRADSILTHNHPPEIETTFGKKWVGDGGSFSEADYAVGAENGFGGIRAVTDKYEYTMRPKDGNWGDWAEMEEIMGLRKFYMEEAKEEINAKLDKITGEVKYKFGKQAGKNPESREILANAQIEAWEAIKEANHQSWVKVTEDFPNLEYTRVEV